MPINRERLTRFLLMLYKYKCVYARIEKWKKNALELFTKIRGSMLCTCRLPSIVLTVFRLITPYQFSATIYGLGIDSLKKKNQLAELSRLKLEHAVDAYFQACCWANS